MKINIDRESLYKNTKEFNYLDYQVILNLEPINIYIEVSEENLGRKNLHPYIEPIVKEYFITVLREVMLLFLKLQQIIEQII